MMIASRKKKLIYKDVYAGEVWLCSGQSNMGITLIKYLKEHALDDDTIFQNPEISLSGIWVWKLLNLLTR